ncbi:hypothetical protein T492DRAFT_269830 [Pavlovales sp. CCMP2436]|nr:hypothetical protein T492DRAFT_269830 [Pavlovales sp. CCMP2436]
MYFCCWFQERAVEWIAGDGDAAPLLITFEENARGIHFDAVEVVFIMGMPSNPSTYLHLAGRTGRQPVLDGTVVTVCTRKAARELDSWSNQLGGVIFSELAPLAKAA